MDSSYRDHTFGGRGARADRQDSLSPRNRAKTELFRKFPSAPVLFITFDLVGAEGR